MSVSLFGLLNMAGQSLSVEQEATVVTGQNLANVNNPAYADQQLQIQAATPLQTTIGQEGTGVEAVSITQTWDSLLNSQITSEDSVTGSLNSQQSALQQAEAYLNEELSGSSSTSSTTSSPDGLAADLSNFFGSLQTLTTNATSIPDRQAVVQAAQQLTQQFNQVSSGLATVTTDLNTSIQNDVASSNQDLTQIASLNQQIVLAQARGGTANDLIDERQQTIEDLAGKVNLTTSNQANGAVNVSIGGVTMVSGGTTPDSLGTYTNGSGQLMIQAQTAGTPLTLSGGSIEGSITARDGTVATLQSSLDTLATQLIGQFNTVYSSGYDLNGNSQPAFFTGTGAANIGVNSTVVNDPSTFQASGSATATGDNTVAVALANLATQSLSGLNNQTLSANYAQTVGTFGSSLQSVNEQLANSTSVSQMLTSQRSSETGVDTDTEMTNLMQFQKAYEASAELVSTVNEMLQTVINMKTS
jgi:flagellar hook-associated protein 1